MGWDDIDLSNVNPNYELVAPNMYIFQVLPGAKVDTYNSLDIPVNIASEGDFAGRRLFLKLPDASREKCGWVPKALKRLEQALGIEQEQGETVVNWLNRVGSSFGRFSAPLTHRTYKNKSDEDVTIEDVKLSKATAAA